MRLVSGKTCGERRIGVPKLRQHSSRLVALVEPCLTEASHATTAGCLGHTPTTGRPFYHICGKSHSRSPTCGISAQIKAGAVIKMAASFNITKAKQPSPGRHGGKRPGAGRKPNSQLGGVMTGKFLKRQDNTDITQRRRYLQDQIIGSDRDPLVVLIDLACDKAQAPDLRVEAAGIACRYVHPTLAQAQISMLHQKADPVGAWQVINQRLDRLSSPEVANAAPRTRLHAVQTQAASPDANEAEEPLQTNEEAA